MRLKILSVVIVVTLSTAQGLTAQSISGPANMPPAGFAGQQFVDSRGCLFMRAGYGGQTTWVPRISASRKALCGQTPTFGAQPVIAMDDQPEAPAVVAAPVVAQAPAPKVAVMADAAPRVKNPGQPMDTVASAMVSPQPVQARPDIVINGQMTDATTMAEANLYRRDPAAAGVSVVAGAEVVGRSAGAIQCYASAPVLERVQLRSGGTALVCTPGDGTLTGWRPPMFPAGSPVGVAISDGVQVRDPKGAARNGVVYGRAGLASNTLPAPPKGYKYAWKDDRLNPNRGLGTAQGQYAQDQIWTRKTPARLVTATARKTAASGNLSVSTMNAPTKAAAQPRAASRLVVQIGAFGVTSNAQSAMGRLSAIGLPVMRGNAVMRGKSVAVVYAGPFGSASEALAALTAARSAGFGDAFIR